MQWILLGVVALALLFMSTLYPRVAFAILGALGVAAAAVVITTRDHARENLGRLPPQDIRIENAVISPGYGDSYQLNARLVNDHASLLLKESVISITMLDCRGDDDSGENDRDCAVIGQAERRIHTRIPAGQARDISHNVFFSGAHPSGMVRWRFKVTETRS